MIALLRVVGTRHETGDFPAKLRLAFNQQGRGDGQRRQGDSHDGRLQEEERARRIKRGDRERDQT